MRGRGVIGITLGLAGELALIAYWTSWRVSAATLCGLTVAWGANTIRVARPRPRRPRRSDS